MKKDIKEVAALFQESFRILTVAKCRTTALATFNRAQSVLDGLERHPDPEAAGHIRKLRANVREAVGRKDKSLHRTMQIHAAFWAQIVQQL